MFTICSWPSERRSKRMLGLGRPRLKGRPSLLDLIAHGAVVESARIRVRSPLSSTSATPPPPALDNLPPLPATPTCNNSISSSPFSFDKPASTPPTPALSPSASSVMAPSGKQRTRVEAGEDQHGSIFSISGPVIIAENMIGCAMYELVSKRAPPSCLRAATRAVLSHSCLDSAVSVTISWPERSFVSKAIELRFRSTKKQVRLPTPSETRSRPSHLAHSRTEK